MLVNVNPFVRGTFSPKLYDRTACNEVGRLLVAAAVEGAAGLG